MPWRQLSAPVEAVCDTCQFTDTGYLSALREKGWRGWTPPNDYTVILPAANTEVLCPACAQRIIDSIKSRKA